MITVGRMPILTPVFLFVIYIFTHYLILRRKKELEAVREADEETAYKVVVFLSKWYPACFLVFTLMILYMG